MKTIQLTDNFPKIVCLCGSTKFYSTFQEVNLIETMNGNIVLSIGCDTKSDSMLSVITEEMKHELDELHKRKIDLASEVIILNVNGYIGESTRSEIEYAREHNKIIRYLERPLHCELCLTGKAELEIDYVNNHSVICGLITCCACGYDFKKNNQHALVIPLPFITNTDMLGVTGITEGNYQDRNATDI